MDSVGLSLKPLLFQAKRVASNLKTQRHRGFNNGNCTIVGYDSEA